MSKVYIKIVTTLTSAAASFGRKELAQIFEQQELKNGQYTEINCLFSWNYRPLSLSNITRIIIDASEYSHATGCKVLVFNCCG